MSDSDRVVPLPKRSKATGRCPVCDKPSAAEHRPFCSRRCADVDLGRWLKGVYRVETQEPPPTAETYPDEDEV